MTKRVTSLLAGLMLVLTGQASLAMAQERVVWGYFGPHGPDAWGKQIEGAEVCDLGQRQSPINIETAIPADLSLPVFDYRPGRMILTNQGRTVYYEAAPDSLLKIGSETFVLTHATFHTPSEHRIGGHHFAMEMQLHHKRQAGGDGGVIVSVLMDIGQLNRPLDRLWKVLPEAGKTFHMPGETFDLRSLLPTDLSYYRYTGSLSVPPCTENIDRFILAQPVAISQAQAAKLQRRIDGETNARPVQPLNGRFILLKQ